MLDPSNIMHLGVFVVCFFILDQIARNVRAKKIRVTSNLIQLGRTPSLRQSLD